MTTDPLCPQQHTHPKHNPNRCIFCEYGAAVREDERTCGCKFWRGYAAALRDAKAAVEAAVTHRGGYHSAGEFSDCAVAAIAALGGER